LSYDRYCDLERPFEAHLIAAGLGRSVGFYRDVVGLEPAFEDA
jgi:hypothetical protein